MTTFETTGRRDLADYFELSGIREEKALPHTPFLAFLVEGERVRVQIVASARALLCLPDDTPVMGQWTGNWRSDFFRFTVGEFRAHVAAFPCSSEQRARGGV